MAPFRRVRCPLIPRSASPHASAGRRASKTVVHLCRAAADARVLGGRSWAEMALRIRDLGLRSNHRSGRTRRSCARMDTGYKRGPERDPGPPGPSPIPKPVPPPKTRHHRGSTPRPSTHGTQPTRATNRSGSRLKVPARLPPRRRLPRPSNRRYHRRCRRPPRSDRRTRAPPRTPVASCPLVDPGRRRRRRGARARGVPRDQRGRRGHGRPRGSATDGARTTLSTTSTTLAPVANLATAALPGTIVWYVEKTGEPVPPPAPIQPAHSPRPRHPHGDSLVQRLAVHLRNKDEHRRRDPGRSGSGRDVDTQRRVVAPRQRRERAVVEHRRAPVCAPPHLHLEPHRNEGGTCRCRGRRHRLDRNAPHRRSARRRPVGGRDPQKLCPPYQNVTDWKVTASTNAAALPQ